MKKVELNKPVEAKKSTTTKTSGSQIKTKKLLLKETFMCTVAEVYNVRKYCLLLSEAVLYRFLLTNKESMPGLVERCNLIT